MTRIIHILKYKIQGYENSLKGIVKHRSVPYTESNKNVTASVNLNI